MKTKVNQGQFYLYQVKKTEFKAKTVTKDKKVIT